jgi:hypothetical protein
MLGLIAFEEKQWVATAATCGPQLETILAPVQYREAGIGWGDQQKAFLEFLAGSGFREVNGACHLNIHRTPPLSRFQKVRGSDPADLLK